VVALTGAGYGVLPHRVWSLERNKEFHFVSERTRPKSSNTTAQCYVGLYGCFFSPSLSSTISFEALPEVYLPLLERQTASGSSSNDMQSVLLPATRCCQHCCPRLLLFFVASCCWYSFRCSSIAPQSHSVATRAHPVVAAPVHGQAVPALRAPAANAPAASARTARGQVAARARHARSPHPAASQCRPFASWPRQRCPSGLARHPGGVTLPRGDTAPHSRASRDKALGFLAPQW